jgi:hypothetical protein
MLIMFIVLLGLFGVIASSIIWLTDAYNAIMMITWMIGCVRSEPVAIETNDEISEE